jgi:hypothetical protein
LFDGNVDSNTPKSNHFNPAIIARYIKIYLVGSYSGERPCLRIDYFGCPVGEFTKNISNIPLRHNKTIIP